METAIAAIAITTLSWLIFSGSSQDNSGDNENSDRPSGGDSQEYELILRPKKKQ